MLEIVETKKFGKDLKLAKKRGKSLEKIWKIIDTLSKEEHLAEKHRQHSLSGQWNLCDECHIEPDWLLIYRVGDGRLYLLRTGTHSDLF